LTWSRVQGTLDPHIRFLIGSMFSFERTNFKCLATLAFVLLPYRVDLYIIPQPVFNVNTFLQVFLSFLLLFSKLCKTSCKHKKEACIGLHQCKPQLCL